MSIDEIEFELELIDERELAPQRTPLPARAASHRARHLMGRLRTRALVAQSAPSPRAQSVVRRFIWEDAPRCLERFDALTSGPNTLRPARLRFGDERFRLDPEHHDHRLPARLAVSWSVSTYPVWLSLEPWWGERAVIGVELRSRHRLHYSQRYFDTAHDALRDLVERMGAPIGPRTITPPRRPKAAAAAGAARQAEKGAGRSPLMLARSITRLSGK